jgi:Chaperone of endosialidase
MPPPPPSFGFDIHLGHLVLAEGDYSPTLNTVTISEVFNHELAHPIQLVGVTAESFIDFIDFTNSGHLPLVSDLRLKEDVFPLERLGNGLALYRFRYKWSNQQYVGVIAQEVAETHPDAIVSGPDGYLRVDYERLRLQMMTWNEWVGANQRSADQSAR